MWVNIAGSGTMRFPFRSEMWIWNSFQTDEAKIRRHKNLQRLHGIDSFPLWSSKHTRWHRKWNETPEESVAVLYWVSSAWPIIVLRNSLNSFQEEQQMIGASTLRIHCFKGTIWLHVIYNRQILIIFNQDFRAHLHISWINKWFLGNIEPET